MPRIINPNPTYGTGFARNADESAYKDQWRGLIAAYAPFLGPTGQLMDWSGNKNHGTLTNMDATDWQGDALDFPGTNEYVDCGTGLALTTNSFSVALWVKAGFPSGKNYSPFISNREGSSPNSGFLITQDWSAPNGFLRFQLNDQANAHDYQSGTINVLDEVWHHIVLACDRVKDLAHLYVDGVVDAGNIDISAVNGSILSSNPIEIGHDFFTDPNAAEYYTGKMHQVRIYNRALTANEVAEQYVNPKGWAIEKARPFGFAEAGGAGISMPLVMQQMNQFDGGGSQL